MLLLAVLLCASPADVQARLRHLDSVAAAWAPAPSQDVTRLAFLTTLFGTRQAASMAVQGSYPIQLTDEPSGVVAIQYVPGPARQLIATALRDGRKRLLLVDEEGAAPVEIDPAQGDQILGGFPRDGKRVFYAVVDGGRVALRIGSLESRRSVDVAPPPPAAGVKPAKDSVPLAEALADLVTLGPPAPDARSLLAVVRRGAGDAVALVDLVGARATWLTPADPSARFMQPRFSPDGRTVYVLTNAGRATLGVDAITVHDHTRKTVFAPPQNVDAFAVTDDGHRLAVAVEANGTDLFSVLDLPSLRPQPLAVPSTGALAEDRQLVWDRPGERLFFGWRLADDTTDVWQLRLGYGTPVRLTRSPRPGLPPDAIVRPNAVQIGDRVAWLWRPPGAPKPHVAVLVSATETRPVFDKRITALNFAGIAVLAVNGKDAQGAALSYLASVQDLDGRSPVLINPDDIPVHDAAKWRAVLSAKGKMAAALDPDHPDLGALVQAAQP